MSGIGAKLSRHVLGMKFMRKTKNQFDKDRIDNAHRDHFSPALDKGQEAAGIDIKKESTSEQSTKVEELWSYNQCERYIFGRQSFGGFNPVVENNLKKGIWKPFYLDESEQIDNEEEEISKRSDVDVSDEEMAKTYGSIVGTLAKRFMKKRKENAGLKGKDKGSKEGGRSRKFFHHKGKFQRDKKHQKQDEDGGGSRNWKGGRKRNRQHESTAHHGKAEPKSSKSDDFAKKGRRHLEDHDDDPPKKKRKFLKPSDD